MVVILFVKKMEMCAAAPVHRHVVCFAEVNLQD